MFLQQLVNGLTIGSTYALVAIGYTMVFGVLELVNLSHGTVYMLGAYISAIIMTTVIGFWPAFLLSLITCGLVGICIDRFALFPLRKNNASKTAALISTVGISTFLQNAILLIFGTESKPFPNVFNLGNFTVGNVVIGYIQIIIFILALILMLATSFLVYRTEMGRAMRATAQNVEATKLMGIDVDKVITFTFFFGSFLAAIAGTLIGMYYRSVDITMGFTVGMKTFASAVLGGIGILPGAMLGGIIIGVAETLVAGYLSAGYKDAVAFIILIFVLLVKPSGLLGRKNIVKV